MDCGHCFGDSPFMPKTHRAPFAVEVGQRLARARQAAGYSQKQLAERLGVSAPKLSNWENGINMLPPEYARKVFLETRIDVDYLYLDDDSRLPHELRTKLRAAPVKEAG